MTSCCQYEALCHKKWYARHRDHPVYHRNVLEQWQRLRQPGTKHDTPEKWLADMTRRGQKVSGRRYKTFTVVLYTVPGKRGRACVQVDPDVPDTLSALAYQIVQASGMGSKRVALSLSGKPITKVSDLQMLRSAAPYSLQVAHNVSAAHAIQVPSQAPVAPDYSDATPMLTAMNDSAENSVNTLHDVLSVAGDQDATPDNTVVAHLAKNIASAFGAEMARVADDAGFSARDEALNAYHTAHSVALNVVTSPDVYHSALISAGMAPKAAKRVTPDSFWNELAELGAMEAGDNIAKSIADSVAAMPADTYGTDPATLYATQAAGSGILAGWMNDLRRLFGVNRRGARWAYRLEPGYSVYHYVPTAVAPGVANVRYAPHPIPYRRGRKRPGHGRQWILLDPYRLTVAGTIEQARAMAASAAASAAASEMSNKRRQDELAARLSRDFVEVDACTDAAQQVDVTTSCASATVSVIEQTEAAAQQVDVTTSVGAVNFSTPTLVTAKLEKLAPIGQNSDVNASLITASAMNRFADTLDRSRVNELCRVIMSTCAADLHHTCALVLPHGMDGSDAVMEYLRQQTPEARAAKSKSMADHYSIPATGHADQLSELFSGRDNAQITLNSRATTQWRLGTTADGKLTLSNPKKQSAIATAYRHPDNANVLVFTAPIFHNSE